MSDNKPDYSDVPVRPAATVVLLRDGEEGLETLLLRRNSALAFAAGAWVFPGGRFEDSDAVAAGTDDPDLVARFAAARETEEETGLKTSPDDFTYFAHWTTPPLMPKRYATWFFMTRFRDTSDVIVDGFEIEDHVWATPGMALQRHANKEIELMPPTYVTLVDLQGFDSAAAAFEKFDKRPPRIYEPHFSKLGEDTVALYAGDAGFENSDASIAGPRHRCVMANSGWSYEYQP